jgi:hypothetical protein
MIQRQVTHPAGYFRCCIGCGKEPMHIISHGVTAATPSDPRKPSIGDRHHLECPRCNRRTQSCETLDEADAEWGAQKQIDLPLSFRPFQRAA